MARLANELSPSRAFSEPSPSRARVAWLITRPIGDALRNRKSQELRAKSEIKRWGKDRGREGKIGCFLGRERGEAMGFSWGWEKGRMF